MTNIKKGTTDTTDTTASTEGRKPRKKVYERINESKLPAELIEHFKKKNYDLKPVRWMLHGEEQYRYLHRREREGYEFVEVSEIPQELFQGLRVQNTKSHAGIVTMGDLVLMKIAGSPLVKLS